MPELSPAEIKARFEEEGYVSPIRVLSHAEARACREELEAFERAHPDQIGLYDMKANLLFPWIDKLTRNMNVMRALDKSYGVSSTVTLSPGRILM